MTTPYCTWTEVKQRFAGDIPNFPQDYDIVGEAKCIEVSADIDRKVAQGRGIRGAFSFLADTEATTRRLRGRNRRYLPIPDCVEVTAVTNDGTVLTADQWVPDPPWGTPIEALYLVAGVWSSRPGSVLVTARWGYADMVPTDVRECALVEAIRSYLADRAGNDDRLGMTPWGSLITSKAFTSKLRELVSDYSYGGGFMRG